MDFFFIVFSLPKSIEGFTGMKYSNIGILKKPVPVPVQIKL
jgi:hypothetical protein